MSDPRAGTERPYQIDDEWGRAVHASRTGRAAEFLAPHLQRGMRLIDCGCGPGSITVDLAQAVAPGIAIGIDFREDGDRCQADRRSSRWASMDRPGGDLGRLPYPRTVPASGVPGGCPPTENGLMGRINRLTSCGCDTVRQQIILFAGRR